MVCSKEGSLPKGDFERKWSKRQPCLAVELNFKCTPSVVDEKGR